MRIAIGSDPNGYALKEDLKTYLLACIIHEENSLGALASSRQAIGAAQSPRAGARQATGAGWKPALPGGRSRAGAGWKPALPGGRSRPPHPS